mmetsp:Transcript_3188/g.9240  ORF Transcript_3188/g.9240 Transcript_3188/m.9240 type:complete len:211 (+) Transcript_3188:74-706(+)
MPPQVRAVGGTPRYLVQSRDLLPAAWSQQRSCSPPTPLGAGARVTQVRPWAPPLPVPVKRARPTPHPWGTCPCIPLSWTPPSPGSRPRIPRRWSCALHPSTTGELSAQRDPRWRRGWWLEGILPCSPWRASRGARPSVRASRSSATSPWPTTRHRPPRPTRGRAVAFSPHSKPWSQLPQNLPRCLRQGPSPSRCDGPPQTRGARLLNAMT